MRPVRAASASFDVPVGAGNQRRGVMPTGRQWTRRPRNGNEWSRSACRVRCTSPKLVLGRRPRFEQRSAAARRSRL